MTLTTDDTTHAASRYAGRMVDRIEAMTDLPKLHLGCGDVYLDGWVNVDAAGPLATDAPELVDANRTTLGTYYQKPYVHQPYGHDKRGRVVADVNADVAKLDTFGDGRAGVILTVNVIDHLRRQDLPGVVREWRRVLADDGWLIIDVGDVVETAKLLTGATTVSDTEWALRLLYCHARDVYDCHHWGYTPAYLARLMHSWGFVQAWTSSDLIEHVYPAFQSCFVKA